MTNKVKNNLERCSGFSVHQEGPFDHINFLKVGTNPGTTRRLTRGKSCFVPVFRGEHINFLAWFNPGTTSRLSQGHLDVNQSKKFMIMGLFSPGIFNPGLTSPIEIGNFKPGSNFSIRIEFFRLQGPLGLVLLLILRIEF